MKMLLLSVLMVMLLAQAAIAGAEPVFSSLTLGGEQRGYWIYKPEGLERTKTAPLLFVLHGSAGRGSDMIKITQSGLERLADKEKFIVIYPDSLERRWNEQGGTADDAGFLLAIVDKLAAESLVNTRRVYFTGISNGGMMAQRLGCEHADRVAGIVTVAGGMPDKLAAVCKPSRAVPTMVIQGTDDPIVPWAGGPVAGFEVFGNLLSAAATAEFWSANNRCRSKAATVAEPDRDPQDGTRVKQERFTDCAGQADVVLLKVEGGGHTWPGGFQYLPERFIGKTSRDFDANPAIWNFLKGFAVP